MITKQNHSYCRFWKRVVVKSWMQLLGHKIPYILHSITYLQQEKLVLLKFLICGKTAVHIYVSKVGCKFETAVFSQKNFSAKFTFSQNWMQILLMQGNSRQCTNQFTSEITSIPWLIHGWGWLPADSSCSPVSVHTRWTWCGLTTPRMKSAIKDT